MDALRQIEEWGAEHAAAAVLRPGEVVARHGDEAHVFRWASIAKPVTALALLVAAEEGTVDLDDPVGPPGSTLRHLLSHASGLPFSDEKPIAPGVRRIYSDTGIELAARHLEERSGMPFAEYLSGAVLDPLGMGAELRGSPASELWGTLGDLIAFGHELQVPTLIAPETLHEMTAVVAFPGLMGVLPGFGRFDPNDWGLGIELRDGKQPHWTGTGNSARTFGHFGGSGTFLWVDPEPQIALACLTDREFGEWAKEAWSPFADDVLGAV